MSKKTYPLKTLDDKMPFGKYKDISIEEIILTDSNYITWCIENVDGFELNNEAWELYQKQLKR